MEAGDLYPRKILQIVIFLFYSDASWEIDLSKGLASVLNYVYKKFNPDEYPSISGLNFALENPASVQEYIS